MTMFRNPSGLYYNNLCSSFYPLGAGTLVISIGNLIASPRRCQAGGKTIHSKTRKISIKMDKGSEANIDNKPKRSSSLVSKMKKVSYQGSEGVGLRGGWELLHILFASYLACFYSKVYS